MGTLFIAIILGVVLAVGGIIFALGQMSQKKALAQREAASLLRKQRASERKVSPQPMPAVKRSRMATPVGARR